jgi:hypothetical protein
MRRTTVVLLLGVVGLLPACGSGGDVGPADCKQLEGITCNRMAQCNLLAGATVADCIASIEADGVAQGKGCSAVKGVSPNFTACINDMAAYDCTLLGQGTKPASCVSVLTY